MSYINIQLSEPEKAMFNEIFSILNRYSGKTREFGMQLIHNHFAIDENEILHETHDEEQRLLEIKPTFLTDLPKSAKATAWAFAKTGQPKVIQMCCDR